MEDLRVGISGKQFQCKVTAGVIMIYLSTSMSVIDSVLAQKKSHDQKKQYWAVCKWDLLVLRMAPAAAASIVYHLQLLVSLSAWRLDEASISQCFAQLDAHPLLLALFISLLPCQ